MKEDIKQLREELTALYRRIRAAGEKTEALVQQIDAIASEIHTMQEADG